MSELKASRYFTPREANDLLPEVVSRLTTIGERVREAQALARRIPDGDPAQAEAAVRGRLERLQNEVEGLLDEINASGVHVKGVEPGLLDFPALHNGREVFLCWREGESRVENWHPLHTGFAGRQTVDFDDLGVWEWCH